MQHLSFLLSQEKEYKQAQKEASKTKYKAQLLQLFCGKLSRKLIQKSLEQLKKDFPSAIVVGTTTAGEISHGKMYEEEMVVSLSLFQHTKLKVSYVKEIKKSSGEKAAKALHTKETKAMIVLGEGLKSIKYEKFLNGIKSVAPKLIIAGGLAGDNFKLKETFVFLDTKIYDEGAVLVSFSSKKLFASNKYNLNWTPIGKEFVITKSEGNKVLEIDNISALAFFEKYLGKEVLEYSALALPNFQLLFKEGETTVARTPMAIDGQSIVFAGPIQKDQVVQFGFSNEASVIDGAYEIRGELKKFPAEAVYIFSCIARKTLLGKVLEKEFDSFEDLAPTAGFFTYGEFYSTSARDVLLNCTTTLLVLSESSQKKKLKNLKHKTKTLDNITFNALTHFIKQTSLELKTNVNLMNQYKDVVDSSLLVSKTDPQGYITYVNDNFCKISKYTKEELLGQNHNIVRDPEVSSFIFKKMWQDIQAGKIWKGSFPNLAKDGSRYYVEATIMPIFNDTGEITEYIAIRQDITKQIQGKKRMQEKERLIRAVFDNQDSVVIHASKTKGMLSVNKKLFYYFDYKNFEDFKSKNNCICDLFLEEEGYIYPKKYPNWLEDIAHDEVRDYKVKMKIKTGEIHTFTIKIKPIGGEYIINLYDITKLEEALLQAHSSEKAKSIFLANMSHEIRTPLNGILGFTDLLTRKNLDKDTKKYVDIIHKSGETLLSVVNDILDFSKIESGELSLYEAEANLFEEMEASVSTFASVARNKKINYYTYIDTKIPKLIKCDIQRLKQVTNNLISNAIKFTPQDGEVTVKIELKELRDSRVTLSFLVQDSGIGIEKEKISTIFNAFSQADNSISREFGGTGLGLAISNQYVQMMGSEINVESELNKGSKFFFDLTFDVIDTRASVDNSLDISNIKITVLDSNEGISCGINKIVYTYLKAWNCKYKEIDSIAQIDDSVNILIICAKLVDVEICKEILEKYNNLHIIYIEGAENEFSCEHERFYLIEQPMTGSILFDRLITLMDPSIQNILENKELTQKNTENFRGKVLVAEDNETNQMLISIMLDERGVEYKLVNNGQEAFDEAMENDSYDFIFMDINMPVLDGIEATKQLRKAGYNKPIISLSANVIESDTQAFKKAGVDDTLNKPIIPAELDAILTKYLKEDNFEKIDIQKIGKSLHIENDTIIIALLHSLLETFEEVRDEVAAGNLDGDILHKLKGAAGNMRINGIYTLAQKFEEEIASADTKKKEEMQKLLLAHLDDAIEQIAKLDR